MQQPLSGLGMQNGCWVMITETKGEGVDLKKMNDIEKCVEKTADQRAPGSAGFSGQGTVM